MLCVHFCFFLEKAHRGRWAYIWSLMICIYCERASSRNRGIHTERMITEYLLWISIVCRPIGNTYNAKQIHSDPMIVCINVSFFSTCIVQRAILANKRNNVVKNMNRYTKIGVLIWSNSCYSSWIVLSQWRIKMIFQCQIWKLDYLVLLLTHSH